MRGVSGVVGDDGGEVEYPAHIVPGQVEPRRLLEVLPGDVRLYRLPSHISKMVLLTVQSGPASLNPPESIEGSLRVLPVHLTHQRGVLFGDHSGTVVEDGAAYPLAGRIVALSATLGVLAISKSGIL